MADLTRSTLGKIKKDLPKVYNHYNRCKTSYMGIMLLAGSDDLEVVIKQYEDYNIIFLGFSNEVHKNTDQINSDEQLKDIIDTMESELYYFDQQINLHISSLVVKSNKAVIKTTKTGLVNQLSIFSIVLSILTFVLNNAKLFSMDRLNFYAIMAGNVSFILMATVMFSLIYIFLHLDDKREHVCKTICRYIIMGLIVALLCFTTFKLTEKANVQLDNLSALDSSNSLSSDTTETSEVAELPTSSPTSA